MSELAENLDGVIQIIKDAQGKPNDFVRAVIKRVMGWEEKEVDWMIYILIMDGTLDRSVMSDEMFERFTQEVSEEEEDITQLSAFHTACMNVWDSEIYTHANRPAAIKELVSFIDPKYGINEGMFLRYCGYEV